MARGTGAFRFELARLTGRGDWREEDRRREVELALNVGARLPESAPGSLQLRVHEFGAAAGSFTAASTRPVARFTPRERLPA